jgi:hypothetical protein
LIDASICGRFCAQRPFQQQKEREKETTELALLINASVPSYILICRRVSYFVPLVEGSE